MSSKISGPVGPLHSSLFFLSLQLFKKKINLFIHKFLCEISGELIDGAGLS